MHYIDKPNLPVGRVLRVIADYRISKKAECNLNKLGIEIIKTKKHSKLYSSVDGHPDMQICHLGGNKFVCDPYVYEYYAKILNDCEIICGKTNICSRYPYDICYNAASVGNYLIHNMKYTEKTISEHFKNEGNIFINVKQGYSKCSVCIINENAIITSDTAIAKTASEYGISTLYINPDTIKLKGLSNGFIGGATGKISSGKLAIYGNIKALPQYDEFINFCFANQVLLESLDNNSGLYDIGSIIPICEEL